MNSGRPLTKLERSAMPMNRVFGDVLWGLALAMLLVLILLFTGSEDRGFIYVDF